jgi:hypothetical protein
MSAADIFEITACPLRKSYIEVTALIRTVESREWATKIEFKNMDGDICYMDVPCSSLLEQKESLRLLADAGFYIDCNRKGLSDYLISHKSDKRIIKVQ